MLIEFTVGNFRSFKDRETLSMVAANLVSKDKAVDEQNTVRIDNGLTLLKSAATYGANASGKSNLVRAILFMRTFVLNSVTGLPTVGENKIPDERFRLSTETETEPSFFEMVFLLKRKKYRYGFEITPQGVAAEWLFDVPNSREAKLFERQSVGEILHIEVSPRFKAGKRIQALVRTDALFLSVAAQFNEEISRDIRGWFDSLIISTGLNDDLELHNASLRFEQRIDKESFIRFITALDLGIDNILYGRDKLPSADPRSALVYSLLRATSGSTEDGENVEFSPELLTIFTTHQKYDAQGNAVDPAVFQIQEHESAGTRRLFTLTISILDALDNGRIIILDELDAHLHPLISGAIIGLFHSKETNSKDAQLIFTTHDTSILSNKRFRRDQIWFVEKDRFGASHLYSLAEFKIRYDASFEQDYLHGRYGAIPFITGNLQWVLGGEYAEK